VLWAQHESTNNASSQKIGGFPSVLEGFSACFPAFDENLKRRPGYL
jgi:hypothetical protein